MAIEKVIDIKVQGNVDQAVGSLRSQLREAQADVAKLSDKFGATSAEAVKAAQKAAELKDRIGDAKALTDAFNPDAKFRALSSSLSGVAGGFAAAQGGLALFGVESEKVQATLLKVQSAMALSQGIQAVGESIDSFRQLSAVVQNSTAFQKVNSAVTAAAAVIQRVFTGAVNTTAASFVTLKSAIVSTGIGALVVGIGYLVSKMNEGADAAKELTKEQEALNKQLEYTKELSAAAAKSLDYQTQIELASAKQRGASEKELTKIKIDGINEKIKSNAKEIDDIKATKDQEYQLTHEQNKRIQELRNQNLDLLRQGRLEVANFEAGQSEKSRGKEKENFDSSKAIRDEAHKKELEDLAELQKQKAAKIQEDFDNLYKANQDAQQILNESTMTQEEIELAAIDKKYQDQIALATKLGQDTTALTDAFALERTGIMQKYATEEDRIKAEQKAKDEELSKSNIKLAEAEAAAKEALMSKTASVLSKGADLLGKNTAASKAMSIAAATINTYQGITAELATKTVTPFEIGLKIANVAIIAATGFKAVKDIISVKVPGGGGGGAAPNMGTMPGGGGATAPQFNVVGSTGVNQLAGVMGEQQQTPVQAYVVANNVTTAQSLDRNIIQSATLGG